MTFSYAHTTCFDVDTFPSANSYPTLFHVSPFSFPMVLLLLLCHLPPSPNSIYERKYDLVYMMMVFSSIHFPANDVISFFIIIYLSIYLSVCLTFSLYFHTLMSWASMLKFHTLTLKNNVTINMALQVSLVY